MAICPTDRIAHLCEDTASFGHLIEFLWAEDRFEAQPLSSANGELICVTDAMLDNRDELAAAFGWSHTDSACRPDSAFVLAAYERWGEACPAHLEGKFAVAIWHRREQRLFCAVDHLGHRPLYYWRQGNELVFATTLRGLFARPRVSRALDENVLAAYVARIDPEDIASTLYRDVRRVPGGHSLNITARDCRLTRHWVPDTSRELHLGSDAEYLEAFRFELERAVETAFRRGPRNVGILLSGGLDSASIAAVAGRLLAAQGRRLQALHLVPTGPNRTAGHLRELDESRHVEAMRASLPEVDFHFVRQEVTASDPTEWDTRFEDNWVPFRHLHSQHPTPATRLLDQLDVGVLLGGGGGNYLVSPDCLATGYLSHLVARGRWLRFVHEFHRLRQVYRHPAKTLFRQAILSPLKHALLPPAPLGPNHPVYLLHPELRARTRIEDRIRAHQSSWSAPTWNYRARLGRVLREVARQQIGASPSVIQRGQIPRISAAPMFDRRLNEFCLALPPSQQIRSGWDRRLLREAMRDRLPDAVRLRVTRGFPQPAFRTLFIQAEKHLRHELDRLGSTSSSAHHLDMAWVRNKLSGADNASPHRERNIIDAVMLGRFLEWHQRHQNRA